VSIYLSVHLFKKVLFFLPKIDPGLKWIRQKHSHATNGGNKMAANLNLNSALFSDNIFITFCHSPFREAGGQFGEASSIIYAFFSSLISGANFIKTFFYFVGGQNKLVCLSEASV
jgi:hypothetical protein